MPKKIKRRLLSLSGNVFFIMMFVFFAHCSYANSLQLPNGFNTALADDTSKLMKDFFENVILPSKRKYYDDKELMSVTSEKLVEKLPRYRFLESEDLNDCLKEFAQDIMLEKNISDQDIYPLLGGLSGDLVFHVKVNDKDIVIKLFKNDGSANRLHYFFQETFSTLVINKLNLENFSSVEMLGAASCQLKDTLYAMNAQAFVVGTSIQEYIDNIVEHEVGTLGRENALGEAIEVFQVFGYGMAEFHYKKAEENYGPPHPINISKITNEFMLARNKLKKYPQLKIDTEILTRYFEYLLEFAKRTIFRHGYMYADVNFNNFLVKKNSGGSATISIIDIGQTYSSIRTGYTPTGMPEFDTFLIMNIILKMQQLLLQTFSQKSLLNEESYQLTKAFKDAYIRNGGMESGVLEDKLYELFYTLSITNKLLQEKYVFNDLSSLESKSDKRKWVILNDVLLRLENALKEYEFEGICLN